MTPPAAHDGTSPHLPALLSSLAARSAPTPVEARCADYSKLRKICQMTACYFAAMANTEHTQMRKTSNKDSTKESHAKRLDRVITYVYEHLDDELNLDKLAEVAHMSPYHWHRVYQGMFGESIIATVKRLRLHRAAGYLVQTEMPIELIAERCGYPNLQSFTRIFNTAYGLPPAKYRKAGHHGKNTLQKNNWKPNMYPVEITTIEEIDVSGLAHQGSYMNIGMKFEKLFGTLGAKNLLQADTRVLAIYYDNPATVAEAELRSFACANISGGDAEALGMETKTIAAGKYAVLQYKGPYPEIAPAYEWLYGHWLPESTHEAADQPAFEEYLNNPREVAPADLLTNIYLPLQS